MTGWIEWGIGATAAIWAHVNAPWLAHQILAPRVGSVKAYYLIGQLHDKGIFLYAGPAAFTLGVAVTRLVFKGAQQTATKVNQGWSWWSISRHDSSSMSSTSSKSAASLK